jgi:hypothetical protein
MFPEIFSFSTNAEISPVKIFSLSNRAYRFPLLLL